jgi:hypothetical protein
MSDQTHEIRNLYKILCRKPNGKLISYVIFANGYEPITFHNFHRQYTDDNLKVDGVFRSDVISHPFDWPPESIPVLRSVMPPLHSYTSKQRPLTLLNTPLCYTHSSAALLRHEKEIAKYQVPGTNSFFNQKRNNVMSFQHIHTNYWNYSDQTNILQLKITSSAKTATILIHEVGNPDLTSKKSTFCPHSVLTSFVRISQ